MERQKQTLCILATASCVLYGMKLVSSCGTKKKEGM
jgi:hypothetical protein